MHIDVLKYIFWYFAQYAAHSIRRSLIHEIIGMIRELLFIKHLEQSLALNKSFLVKQM